MSASYIIWIDQAESAEISWPELLRLVNEGKIVDATPVRESGSATWTIWKDLNPVADQSTRPPSPTTITSPRDSLRRHSQYDGLRLLLYVLIVIISLGALILWIMVGATSDGRLLIPAILLTAEIPVVAVGVGLAQAVLDIADAVVAGKKKS